MEIAGAVDDEHIENTAAAVARCIADELALADEVADILFILAEIAVHGHDGIFAVGHGGGIGLAAAGVFILGDGGAELGYVGDLNADDPGFILHLFAGMLTGNKLMGDFLALKGDLDGRILIGHGLLTLESPAFGLRRLSALEIIQGKDAADFFNDEFGLGNIRPGKSEDEGQDHQAG